MIEFDCLCRNYRFSVPTELAGEPIQCPECRRLVDVPTESEAQQIDEHGGYKINLIEDPQALDADLAIQAFSRDRVDENGYIDMRASFDDVLKAGVAHSPNTYDGTRRVTPRYDPTTGELIRPMAIKDDEPIPVVPLDAEPLEVPVAAVPIVPTISYGRQTTGPTAVAMAVAFAQLLKPANLIVMFFVLVANLILIATGFIVLFGFIFAVIAPLVILMAVIAHYGNIIEEIGPNDRDEVPVPVRNGSISEDIWLPFFQTMVAFIFSFLPLLLMIFFKVPLAVRVTITLPLIIAGFLVLPAMWLTAVTGGVYANLRPDRLLSVIRICGIKYWIAVTSTTGGCLVYLASLLTIMSGFGAFMRSNGLVVGATNVTAGTALLALAIYLLHAAAWQIGLLYRAHHADFPWIMQRHIFRKLAEQNRPKSAVVMPPR